MILTGYSKGSSVYRLRPGTALDSDGDPVESWDSPDRLKLVGAEIQDVSTIEEEGAAKRILQGEKTLFVRRLVDVKAEDRIELDGNQWRVNGDPVKRSGLASGSYTKAALTRISSR